MVIRMDVQFRRGTRHPGSPRKPVPGGQAAERDRARRPDPYAHRNKKFLGQPGVPAHRGQDQAGAEADPGHRAASGGDFRDARPRDRRGVVDHPFRALQKQEGAPGLSDTSRQEPDRPVERLHLSGPKRHRQPMGRISATNAVKSHCDQGTFGIPPFTPHDLRRTVATHMPRTGILREHREAVLNHTMPTVEGTYDLYSYDKEKQRALERWSRELERIVKGETGKVISIRRDVSP